MSWLIKAAQADKFRKSQKSLIIFDASLHLPSAARQARQEFEEKHIAGAKFFDIDLFTDPTQISPHTLKLDEQLISQKLGELGIRNDYKIIFYDHSDLHSAYRALWMMKVFGHNPHLLYILDGGLPAWERYGGKLETGNPTVTQKPYSAKLQLQYLQTLEQMKQTVHSGQHQVVDLRHPVRFAGGAEPRPGIRPGHMPGSNSFPYTNLFDKEGRLLRLERIQKLLESVAINPALPTISTCGSGITAPIFDFILDQIDQSPHAVYGGSWSEWGYAQLYPGEKDLADRPVKTCVDEDLPKKIEC